MARFRLTPGRRKSILKAQRVSARRRSEHGTVLMRMGLSMTANAASFGAAGKVTGFISGNKKRQYKKRKAARKAARRRRRG